MANQNDTFDLKDLDLSMVEGFEGFGDDKADDTPIEEPVYDTPVEEPEDDEPIAAEDDSDTDSDDEPISWSYIESIVPEPLHEDLKPLVEDWQRRYQRIIEETEPLRKYTQQGVTEADIEAALQVQQALIKDPRKFYEGLGETYGWQQEAAGVAELKAQIEKTQRLISQRTGQQQQQADPNSFASYFGFDENDTQQQAASSQQEMLLAKQLQETQERLQQLEQSQKAAEEQRINQEQAEAGRRQLESELGELEKKYGTFDRAEVVKRAVANAHAGNNPSVSHAYHELRDYEENLRRKYAAKRPPKVVGSGSGMTAAAPPDLSTDDAKREAALALALRLGSQT